MDSRGTTIHGIRKVICPSCGHVLCKYKPEDAKRWTLKRACASNKVAVVGSSI